MDKRIYLFVAAILALAFFAIRRRKRNFLINKKKAQLKSLYTREAIFLCEGADNPDDNLIQFYGEPFGTPVRPGMKILVPSGTEYILKEVYANDKTPDKPDSEIPNGMLNTAIVIETDNFDWGSFRESLKRDRVVVLKFR